jgi:hypothetical protein
VVEVQAPSSTLIFRSSRRNSADTSCRRREAAKTAQPSRTTPVDLSVGDDPALSARAKEAFLADIHRGANNGLTGQIELSLQQRNVRSQFREATSPYGLSLDTLPDICAAYYAVMWMIANQAGLPTRPELQGLSRQLRGVFAEENVQLDAARRQLGAEEIMYKTVWLIHLRQEAQHLGNQRAQQQLADIAWQALKREQNLDLREVRLTDAGLVANP